MTTRNYFYNWLIAIFVIIFIILLIAVLSGCKTSRTVTVTKTEFDSTAIHQRDSLRLSIKEIVQKHELDIEAIKNTGVTDSINQSLELRHESDSLAIKNLTALEHSVSKSKPSGIFAAWWLLPLGIVLGAAGMYKFKKKN